MSKKAMDFKGRYFKNELDDYMSKESLINHDNKELTEPLKAEMCNIFKSLMDILEGNANNVLNSNEISVYTGSTGLALLYLFIYDKNKLSNYLQESYLVAKTAVQKRKKRRFTFLCGDLGPLCVLAAASKKLNKEDECKEYLNEILGWIPEILKYDEDLPNELMYGRAGYLYGLLFLNIHIPNAVAKSDIQKVANAIVEAGKSTNLDYLMWSWHGKQYLGGAHGVAGILYLLLQVSDLLSAAQLELIRSTIDHLSSFLFSTGNLRSSVGSEDDRLVQWCHGAPGAVQVFLAAYFTWKDDQYLKTAEKFGDVVWQRGLLKKGYGLCHGVAGNAYAFLSLYQATRKEIHLHRAVQFARWCKTYNTNQERPPDHPYSLFEGLAGTVYFLRDLQQPLEAMFPAFSLRPFTHS